jgi:hypothetical protein
MHFAGIYSAYQGKTIKKAFYDKSGSAAAWRIFSIHFDNNTATNNVVYTFMVLNNAYNAYINTRKTERTGRFNGSRTVSNAIDSSDLSVYYNGLVAQQTRNEVNILNTRITDIADEFDVNRTELANIVAGNISDLVNIKHDKVKEDLLTVLGATGFNDFPPKYTAAAKRKGYEIGPSSKGGYGGTKIKSEKKGKKGKRFIKREQPY